MATDYRAIAIHAGNRLKYGSTLNEITRAAGVLFRFPKEDFPVEGITSQRAKLIYDWVLSLAKQRMDHEERDKLLWRFFRDITPPDHREGIDEILAAGGLNLDAVNPENARVFAARAFHHEVGKHARKLFLQENYFHAVFEASKAYNALVKAKAQTQRDGQALMLEVWSGEKGVLKLTPCLTDTDRSVQDGVKFLSAGLMQAIRNPTAHEPALDWPISREDALDVLSFISFLLRQLDKAVYFKS